jgi:nucleotide-binding universal stress UspA family protein
MVAMLTEILINVPATGGPEPAVNYGLSLAKAFGAHATGVSFGLESIIAPAYFGAIPGEIIAQIRREAEDSAKSAADGFMKAAQGAGVEADARPIVATIDRALDSFGRLARLYDLTVVGQPNPDRPGPQSDFLQAALFESGRAVLVVPYIQKKPMELNRVMIAWDGGRAASRALAEARPLLAKAKQVEVLVVETGKPDSGQIPAADLARHLARHKLKVELRRVLASSKQEIDETILNEISNAGIDLVVMGGYGHSRLREFVLGGTTRSMIQSMTAPVLMAH